MDPRTPTLITRKNIILNQYNTARFKNPHTMHFLSIVDLIISILISVLGILINVKFLKDMKYDEINLRRLGPHSSGLLVKRVMTTYTITLIVSIPIQLIFSWFLYEHFELPPWFQYSLCYVIYIIHGLRVYHAFNSLVVAAMRYSFIVHREAIFRFGKEEAKTLFYYGSIAIPIIMEILFAVSVQTFPFTFISAAISICNESYQDSYSRTDLNLTITQNFSLPVYSFVHQYVSSDITFYFKKLFHLLATIITSNVVEAVLYYKTFAKIRR